MDISRKKNWTVLIYLNGNNDLEPEMWQAKLAAEKIGSNHEVNVLIQIGRENQQLSKIIRPVDVLPVADEKWTGVRRYYVKKIVLT